MLKSLIQKGFSLSQNNARNSFLAFAKTSVNIHTSQASYQMPQDDDGIEYEEDLSSGIKNLEKLGLAKSNWSWPKYNRTVFPPTEDGVPLINPVRTFLGRLLFFFYKYLFFVLFFSLSII